MGKHRLGSIRKGIKYNLIFIIVINAIECISQTGTLIHCADINVSVNPCPNNPSEKEGFNLLLNETFSPITIDEHWNISINGDDDPNCFRLFRKNPDNVTYEQYIPPPPLTEASTPPPPQHYPYHAKIWNTNIPNTQGCPFSSGEIKTMSVTDESFKSYYFYGWGYIEAKLRLFTASGQGAAMWLLSLQDSDEYGTVWYNDNFSDNEVDIFETRNREYNKFDVTYHWRTIPDNIKESESHTVILENHDFTDWTVFGFEWNNQFLRWYVNNTVIHEIWIPGTPPPSCHMSEIYYTQPSGPYCLRFGTGCNSVGDSVGVNINELPQYIEIEYIRAYKKEGELAAPIKIFDHLSQICISANSSSTSDKIISANYYPDATYEWSSSAFEIEPFQFPNSHPQAHRNKQKIWVKEGVVPNQSYPIYLTTTFPWGYVENDVCNIYVAGDVPQIPPDNFFAEQTGNGCFFHIKNPILNESTTSCQFYNFISQTWEPGSIKVDGGVKYAVHYFFYEPTNTYQIKLKEQNTCGFSEVRESQLTMPSPPVGCAW